VELRTLENKETKVARSVKHFMNVQATRILVVEDHDQHQELLRRILEQSEFPRFDVVPATTLREGLDRLSEGGVEIVLLDLNLPDSLGPRTFERVIALTPEVPVVILSGRTDVTLAIELVQRGAQDYLVKGHVDSNPLLRAIRYAIERKRVQIALAQTRDEMEQRVRDRTRALSEVNRKLQVEIAERRAAEAAVLESNQQLASALSQIHQTKLEILERERMQVLGRMANGVAHEFNNVLAPIMGHAEFLLAREEQFQLLPKVREALEKIHAAARAGARVVKRIREHSKTDGPPDTRTRVALSDVINQVVLLTQPRWKGEALAVGKTIEVVVDLRAPVVAETDAYALRDLLTHLVFNAVRSVGTRGLIRLVCDIEGDVPLIKVTDNGPIQPMNMRALVSIPDRLARSSDETLADLRAAHECLKRLGARMEVTATAARENAFIVRFTPPEDGLTQASDSDGGNSVVPSGSDGPELATSESVEESAAFTGMNKQVDEPAPSRKLRLLVAEDEPMVREVLCMYLAEDQHDVHGAENGQCALEAFGEGKYDLVLTDRAMPIINGDQLAVAIKGISPTTPVILLTGFGDAMIESGERPPGVDLIVSKPFSISKIREALNHFFEGAAPG
jgi:DNA-binding response OmpR family regulator